MIGHPNKQRLLLYIYIDTTRDEYRLEQEQNRKMKYINIQKLMFVSINIKCKTKMTMYECKIDLCKTMSCNGNQVE